MAKGNGLSYTARLSVKEAIANAKLLKKELGSIGIDVSRSFDVKPMTAFQQAQIKIKQEALELAKQKAEQAKADKAASLATQQALREERELIKQRNAEAKRARIISESTANDISNSTGGLNGRTVVKGSPILPDGIKKNQIDSTASAYTAQTNAIKENTKVTKENSLSKKELAIIAAQEKLNNQQNAAALKNQVREMNAAKGSIEQRRAALIRLNKVYDNLNVAERQSASGIRLEGIVGRLTTQLKEQEAVTGRAQRNVGNYTSAFANGAGKVWGALKQVANILPGVGIAGLLAFAIDPLMEYLKGLDLFKAKVTQAKVAQEDMAKALAGSEYAKAVTNVNELRINIDLAKQGLISKESVLKQYNETIGKTTGQVKTLDQAEQELNKNADAFIKVTLLKAAAQVALESAAKSAYEAEISRRKKLEEFGNNFLDADVSNVRSEGQYKANQQNIIIQRKRRQAEEVKISQDSANQQIAIAKKFQQDAAKISQSNGFVNFLGNDEKKTVKAIQSQINAQRSLQSEIDALVNKGRGKRLSDDEQELADVDAKYKKLYQKAKNFNDLIAEYNANPKNKNKRQGVNTSGLLFAQSTEEDAVRDKQEANRLKVQLDAQKAIYSDFESYKTKIGEQEARKRFNNEIGSASDYLSFLNQKRNELLGLDDTGKGATASGANNRQQIKLIDEQIALEVEAKKKRDREVYANAVQAALTYDDQIRAINLQYEQFKSALGENATKEQVAQLQSQRDAAKRSVNEQNAVQKSGYEQLMMNFDAMSREQIVKRLNAIKEGYRKEYAEGKLTAEQLSRLVDGINQSIGSITNSNPFNRVAQAVKNYRDQLRALGKDAEGTKRAQEDMFATIADAAPQISNAIGDIAGSLDELGIGGQELKDVFKNVGGLVDGAGTIARGIATGNPIDIVTGSIKFLTSAISLFNTKDKKLEKQIQGYRDQLDQLGKAYKQLERDVANSVGENFYSDSAKQIENLKQQQVALTAARDAERNKKKADQGKIAEFQNQIDAIPGQIEDIQKAVSQSLIQTTFKDLSNALSDAFTEAFSKGEDAAGRFDDVFKKVIANAVQNSLKLRILDPVVKKFTDDLASYAQNNGNSIIGFDFEAYKKQLKDAGDLFTAGLKGSEQFFKEVADAASGASTAVVGQITSAGLTEDTANKSMGIWRGTYDQTKMVQFNTLAMSKTLGSLYGVTIDIFNTQLRIEANTKLIADNTTNLETILKKIDQNTSSSSSYNSLLGSGIKP